jgi:hypothetical protein
VKMHDELVELQNKADAEIVEEVAYHIVEVDTSCEIVVIYVCGDERQTVPHPVEGVSGVLLESVHN